MSGFDALGMILGLCRARRLEDSIHGTRRAQRRQAKRGDARPRMLARRGSASAQRDPDLDCVLALVRLDALKRRHSPLRGNARGRSARARSLTRRSYVTWAVCTRWLAALTSLGSCLQRAMQSTPALTHAQRSDRHESAYRVTRREPGCCRVRACVTDIECLRKWGNGGSCRQPPPSSVERFSNKAARRPMILRR